MQNQTQSKLNGFAEDVQNGLSATPKFLSSKYFYDDAGSRLFQQIMDLPEYYLTRAETDIFQNQSAEIVKSFQSFEKPIDLIELGAGDGTKTALLVDQFLAQKIDFSYVPIDISAQAIESLTAKFKNLFPALSIKPQFGDYFKILESLKNDSSRTKILLFLGSNIGNFSHEKSIEFLRSLRNVINENDFLFIGFDLQKDPRVILEAYDDAAGVTAAFNLNLLKRINSELGGNFVTENFSHYPVYEPREGAAKSFLISRARQSVFIEALHQEFHFAQWEPIFMEISRKYTLPIIEKLAAESGFELVSNFYDEQKFFTDAIFKPV